MSEGVAERLWCVEMPECEGWEDTGLLEREFGVRGSIRQAVGGRQVGR